MQFRLAEPASGESVDEGGALESTLGSVFWGLSRYLCVWEPESEPAGGIVRVHLKKSEKGISLKLAGHGGERGAVYIRGGGAQYVGCA